MKKKITESQLYSIIDKIIKENIETNSHPSYVDKEGKRHYFKNGKWYWQWDDDKPEDDVRATIQADNPITESQLRNIIRKSLCESMNINVDDFNSYLDYITSQNERCKQIVEYLKNIGIDATLKDCSNGGNLQVYCVYASTISNNEMAIKDAVRKICPNASFDGGMAGIIIKP